MARTARHTAARVLAATACSVALTGGLATSAPAAGTPAGGNRSGTHESYQLKIVVADRPVMGSLQDPHVRNPWGLAFGPTTPLWSSNEGTSTSTLYAGGQAGVPVSAVPLVVRTPPSPTGVVFNATNAFRLPDGTPSRFIFATLGGKIAGWAPADPLPTSTTTLVSRKGAQFSGLALAQTAHGVRLYAADTAGGVVRRYDGSLHQLSTLRDPHLPPKLAPYDVAVLGSSVYVSYALPEGVSAPVKGAIDVYTTGGRLVRRLVTGGVLRGPWGMAMAPAHWGRFSGDLLVGNEDGGRINAFEPGTGRFMGTLRNERGQAIARDGLWGMAFGNGVIGTPDDLVVAIGVAGYAHGVIGFIRPSDR